MKIVGVTLPPVLSDALQACRRHFAAAIVFSFFINLLFLAPAIYMLQVFDRVVATGGKTTLLFLTLALATAMVTMTALDAIRTRLLVRASMRLDRELAPVILKRMWSSGGGDSLQAMRDFDTVRQTLGGPAAAAMFDAPWAPIYILFAFLLHPWIGVLAVASILLLGAIAWRNQLATREAVETATKELATAHSAAQNAALHGGTIRALGMTATMTARQLGQRSAGLGRMAQSQFVGSRFAASSRFVRMFVQSAALATGALLAIAGEISAGAIIAGSILLGRSLQPVEMLIGSWSGLSAARAALERLAEALSGAQASDRARTRLPALEGRADVEDVGVAGPDGKAIISGISFAVRPGDVLGIVGPSGSGKTTLARVIAGALNASRGTVRFDGAQQSDWDPDTLGASLGYLPQEPRLFEGTIKDNISRFSSWSEGGQSFDAEVVEAARKAGVHELILKLPEGYDTVLGPNGVGLSAGQAQRIAFARALFGSPNVLILDEPNAFLDADGEAALIRSIDAERRRGATILIVAHRKAVLAAATRLLVLEEGRVKLLGPAAEVVARLTQPPKAESAA